MYPRHALGRRADAVDELFAPEANQRRMFRMARDQFGAGFREGAAPVMLEMPVRRHDIAEKRIERPIIVDQALVQNPWGPVIQEIERASGRERVCKYG